MKPMLAYILPEVENVTNTDSVPEIKEECNTIEINTTKFQVISETSNIVTTASVIESKQETNESKSEESNSVEQPVVVEKKPTELEVPVKPVSARRKIVAVIVSSSEESSSDEESDSNTSSSEDEKQPEVVKKPTAPKGRPGRPAAPKVLIHILIILI